MHCSANLSNLVSYHSSDRKRTLYEYPDSGDEESTSGSKGSQKPLPLSQRLRSLQAELASLEHELSDPSNPLLQKETQEADVDPGELIRGLVGVRSRLDKIVKEKEGRARLVDNILHEDDQGAKPTSKIESNVQAEVSEVKNETAKSTVHSLVDVDRRVEELEKLIGSSNAGLDDVCETFLRRQIHDIDLEVAYQHTPLPPPLLPMITKLNSQLALLTQPRHIDSISRRLKLLLSDLERAAAAQQHRRQGSHANDASSAPSNHEQLLTIVNRIAPSLPQIPHILSHLRSLSTLHSAAGEFQATMKDLEQEQQKIHGGLTQLQMAVETVERSLEANRAVVKDNVSGLDARVNDLLQRLEDIKRENISHDQTEPTV